LKKNFTEFFSKKTMRVRSASLAKAGMNKSKTKRHRYKILIAGQKGITKVITRKIIKQPTCDKITKTVSNFSVLVVKDFQTIWETGKLRPRKQLTEVWNKSGIYSRHIIVFIDS